MRSNSLFFVKHFTLSVFGIFTLLFFCCSFVNASESLESVSSWGIQLQNIDPKKIADAKHDLVVIDYSADGTEAKSFSKEDVGKMKRNGKKVLAAINIGRAEMHRFYWNPQWEVAQQEDCFERYFDYRHRRFDYRNICAQGNSGLVGEKDPEWNGSYYAKYWQQEWWGIALQPYLEKIYSAEFDGVYLMGIDAFEYWGKTETEKTKYATEMAELIVRISTLSRKELGEGFLIIQQNGLEIPDALDARWRQRYFSVVDAIVVESLFFDTTAKDRRKRTVQLQEYIRNQIPIFTLDYSKKKYLERLKERIADFETAYNTNIIPFRGANDEALNELYKPLIQ
jgi:cysteinyl-tRNA synthetase